MSSGSLANRLVSRDPVLVNFRRRYNVSKVAIFHNDGGYLPPPPPLAVRPDFSLPEVIDNRVRNVVAATNETRSYPSAPYLTEQDFLRVLTSKGLPDARYPGNGLQAFQHHQRRPVFPQGKHSRQTTTPLPPLVETPSASSLANRISMEEMSCQNTGDELFFR